jgi:hypothetical protein
VNPALEEGAKLFLDVGRETSLMLLAGLGEESLQVLSNQLIEGGLGSAMLLVFRPDTLAFERAPCQASLARFK